MSPICQYDGCQREATHEVQHEPSCPWAEDEDDVFYCEAHALIRLELIGSGPECAPRMCRIGEDAWPEI
jgi:hypothetical protein